MSGGKDKKPIDLTGGKVVKKPKVLYIVIAHTPKRYLTEEEDDGEEVHTSTLLRSYVKEKVEEVVGQALANAEERIREVESDPGRTFEALDEPDPDSDDYEPLHLREPKELMIKVRYEGQIRTEPWFTLIGKVEEQYFYKNDDGLNLTVLATGPKGSALKRKQRN